MKRKIKQYLNGVWGEEILIAIIAIFVLVISYNKIINNNFTQIGAGIFEALFDENTYENSMVYYDSAAVSKHIYRISENLVNTEAIVDENKYIFGNDIRYQNVYYALLEKNTGRIITNDISLAEYINNILDKSKESPEKWIKDYIDSKKFAYYKVDNEKSKNYYVTFENNVSTESMKKYEEFYYKDPINYSYMIKTDRFTGQLLIAGIIITTLLIIKIIVNLIRNNKNNNLEIKSIKNFLYVLRHGFKYKSTRNKIITSFAGAAIIIIIYLYLVAGIRSENILLTFLQRYPFKGTLIIILIPVISIIYSLKKTLDISIINSDLKKVNQGNLEYDLRNVGENEIIELIDNINQIKDGYKIAVEDRLKNERLKTELISNVSHDLKTPLTSIINYVNILNNDGVTEEERKEYLTILEKKSMKLKFLLEDLFEISKLNSGKLILNKTRLDIVSLVHQGVGEYCSLYEDKNITFKVNSTSEEMFMELDGKLMSRLFENIIINALKYSLPNTRVYVDIIDIGTAIRISFKNIANYEMDFDTEEILGKFVRADKSRTSSIEGSGMGLAISKSILELHNGDLKIEVEGDMYKLNILIPKYNSSMNEKY